MFKTIMVPIDLSHAKEGASMIDIAKLHVGDDTRVILLNVVEEVPTYVVEQLPRGIMAQSRQTAADELKAIADNAGIDCEARVITGHAYRTILETAEDENVDLIIIASHKPGIQDYFLGSTAAHVVRHAKCSVLVVR